MIKYIRHTDILEEGLTTDEYGNKIFKETGDYVIVIEPSIEPSEYKPMSLTKVDGEWVTTQMEFDFG